MQSWISMRRTPAKAIALGYTAWVVNVVRPRERDDLARCVRLLERVDATDSYPMFWPDDPARWLSPAGAICAWIAERGRDVVGHVVLQAVAAGHQEWEAATALRAAELGAISRLFVDPDHRGAGFGGSLLDGATTAALSRGLRPVLDVVETRVNAIRFYERRGFRRVLTKPWSADAERSHHFYVRPWEPSLAPGAGRT